MADLYSVKQGKVVNFDLSVDQDGEIIATNGDEFLKFPAGLTKVELKKAFAAHNTANEGKVALTAEAIEKASQVVTNSQRLIDSL